MRVQGSTAVGMDDLEAHSANSGCCKRHITTTEKALAVPCVVALTALVDFGIIYG